MIIMTERQTKQLKNMVIMYQRNFSIRGKFDQEIFDEVINKIKRHIPFLDEEKKIPIDHEFATSLAGELIHHNVIKQDDDKRILKILEFEIRSKVEDIEHQRRR